MPVLPETVNDTVFYTPKRFYSLENIRLDVESDSVLDIYGSVYINGYPVSTGAYYDIRFFGAKGNGTTDDSFAVRAALAAATPGSVVGVPSGTYLVSRDGSQFYCFNVPTGVKIVGSGTFKLANGQAPSVRMFSVATDNVTFQDISIDMNRANQSIEGNPQRHAIINTGKNLRVLNCNITGPTGDAILFSNGSTNALVQGNTITNCERNGVTFYGNIAGVVANSNIAVIGNYIEADVQAVDSEPTLGYIVNIQIQSNYLKTLSSNYAVTCAGIAANFNTGWIVTGNTLIGSLYCINISNSTIANNTIDARASTTLQAVYALFGSNQINFTGNIVYAATDKYCMHLAISSGARPIGWNIESNVFNVLGTVGEGMHVTGTGPINIVGNQFFGVNSAYGMYCQATADMESVNIANNYLDGFAVAIYAAPFSTSLFNKLSITNNNISNTQAVPVANTGVRLAGTVAQFIKAVVTGNIVDATYTLGEDLSTVIVRVTGNANVGHWSCSGTPETQIVARIGSTCTRRDGGAATTFYVKESGTGATGWVAK